LLLLEVVAVAQPLVLEMVAVVVGLVVCSPPLDTLSRREPHLP
jgi:hypothetical protein